MKKTQCQMILEYLQTHRGITPKDAYEELGVMRLAARISNLRDSGHNILTCMVDVPNRYGETVQVAEYRLVRSV